MLLCDNDLTMEGWNEWRRRIRKYSIEPKYTEPYSPFQNKAEPNIRELKRMIRRYYDKSQSPHRLWNYLANLCANVRSFIVGTHRILMDDLRVNRYTVGRPISSHILMMTMNGNLLAGLASGRFWRWWRCVSTVRIGETNRKEYPVVLNPKQTSWLERQDKGAQSTQFSSKQGKVLDKVRQSIGARIQGKEGNHWQGFIQFAIQQEIN